MTKPQKPYPEFPLFAHARGKWAKKINGETRYFGRWEDPTGALQEYEEWLRSRPTVILPEPVIGLTLKLGFNKYLTQRSKDVESGTLSQRSFTDYKRTLTSFAQFIGSNTTIASLTVASFTSYRNHYASSNNPIAVGNEVTRIRSAFKWLRHSKLIEDIEFGPDFKKPSKKVARRYKRERGKLLYTPAQIHAILNECGIRLRAMVLLGINCAYHNNDIEQLSLAAAKKAIVTNVIELPRAKTEVERGCPIWPETSLALEAWLSIRPKSEFSNCFVRFDGHPFSPVNADVAKQFRTVRDLAGIRNGGYSWLRKTFATFASECADQVAVDAIMGHVDDSIPGLYRQLLRENRLHKATQTVHDWLYDAT